jgi:hypothetical protein
MRRAILVSLKFYPILKMKNFIYFIIIFAAFSNCISTKKYKNYLESKEKEIRQTSEIQLPEFFEVNSDSLKINILSNVIELQSEFIPAIVYWEWNKTFQCKIDPKITVDILKQSLLDFAELHDLQDKMKGKKLQISIEKVPNNFYYMHRGNFFILLISMQMSSREAILPGEQSYKISYNLIENDQIKKTGTLAVINKDEGMRNKKESTRKFTYTFIEHQQDISEKLASKVVSRLFNEL